jgi:hypothetical protein
LSTIHRIANITAVLGLLLLAYACAPKLSDADIQRIGAEVQKQMQGGRGGGSSGDEDAPLTMLGGSLSITLWGTTEGFKLDPANVNRFLHPEGNNREVKRVEYWKGDNAVHTFPRTSGEAWKIVVNYVKGTNNRPVTFITDTNGRNLEFSSHADAKLITFRRVGSYLMEHPRKGADIDTIDIESGTNRTTNVAGCTAVGSGSTAKLQCPCGIGTDKGDCGIVIHYCSSTASSGACM